MSISHHSTNQPCILPLEIPQKLASPAQTSPSFNHMARRPPPSIHPRADRRNTHPTFFRACVHAGGDRTDMTRPPRRQPLHFCTHRLSSALRRLKKFSVVPNQDPHVSSLTAGPGFTAKTDSSDPVYARPNSTVRRWSLPVIIYSMQRKYPANIQLSRQQSCS